MARIQIANPSFPAPPPNITEWQRPPFSAELYESTRSTRYLRSARRAAPEPSQLSRPGTVSAPTCTCSCPCTQCAVAKSQKYLRQALKLLRGQWFSWRCREGSRSVLFGTVAHRTQRHNPQVSSFPRLPRGPPSTSVAGIKLYHF